MKMFSKSYIIPLLEFTFDYIVLNYCSLDTTCFTYTEDNFIRVTSFYDRRLIAPHTQLNVYREKNMSTFTVRRRLCEAGLYGRITVKKLLLRKQNNVKRLQWAKSHKDWTIERWNKVLWTDKSKFEILGSNMRVKYEGLHGVKSWWKSCNPLYHTNCKAWRRFYSGLCWGGVPIAKSGICTSWRANWIRPAITVYCSIMQSHIECIFWQDILFHPKISLPL